MIQLLKILLYYPFINILTFFIWATPGHFAAAGIILLTLLVRFLLFIPSKQAAQVQRRTQQLAPLVEELKREYGDDRNGFAVAQMELYKKNNINPFSSCITLLIQFPVLIILYYSIRYGLSVGNPHVYSWMVHPTFINTNFFGINLTVTDHTYILPVIAAVLQYLQMHLTVPKQEPGAAPDPTAAAQRSFKYVIPVTTLLFAARFPAGVALYWIISTAFGVVQQMLVNREKLTVTGVTEALKEADVEHPEHKPRTQKVLKEIAEETNTKAGVQVTVRKKKSK